MQTLAGLYRAGHIVYPRVENNYIPLGALLSYYPHAPLPSLNGYMEPLRLDEYEYNENSLLLHLHNLRILTPSLLENTKKAIDSFKNGKKKAELTIEAYSAFIEDYKKIHLDYFIRDDIAMYATEKPRIYEFKANEVNSIDDLLALQRKIVSDSPYTDKVQVESFEDNLESFQKNGL